jgi:hypothetical protein
MSAVGIQLGERAVEEARRLPLVDFRAWARVFPRQRRRDLFPYSPFADLPAHWRVEGLTKNPHFDCDHARGICLAGRGAVA